MKLPEYSLKKGIEVPTGPGMDPLQFPSGTLVFPFWNEFYVPSHRMEALKDARRYTKEPLVMCIIGATWIPIPVSNIRKGT